MPDPLVENAPAKVNLTLRVLGRRSDGYHEIESLVVFADVGDTLSFSPGGALALTVSGPSAAAAGDDADNLVLKAAGAVANRIADITLGTFRLDKRLPVAAGLGGGSADAAAALRLLARANGLGGNDARFYDAARATGADVPVCLDPRSRYMRGIGEILSEPLSLPPLPAVLVNPGVAVATKAVFAGWLPPATPPAAHDAAMPAKLARREVLMDFIASQANDLEAPAIALAPAVGGVIAALRGLPGCEIARMSGSGATCFALFKSGDAAASGAEALQRGHPEWWVRATMLGGG